MTLRTECLPATARQVVESVPPPAREHLVRTDHVTRALVRAVDEYSTCFEYRRQCLRRGIQAASLDPLASLYSAFVRFDPKRATDLAALISCHWRALNAMHAAALRVGGTACTLTVLQSHSAQAAHALAVRDLRQGLVTGRSRPGLKVLLALRARRCWVGIEHGSRRLVDRLCRIGGAEKF